MSLISMIKGAGPSGFGYGSTAEQVTDGLALTGKTYLITGCTSGLGAEAMRVLVLRGARVLGTARTWASAEVACRAWGDQAVPLACELSEPASVHSCVAEVKAMGISLDGIIANAGIMALPTLTVKHGLELQFLTNHMGHFLLVTGLLSQLASDGRVVMLSSSAHQMAPKEGIQFGNLDGQQGYSAWAAYGQSKLANLLFAKELAKRLPGPNQTANAVHPGVINTGLQRSMSPLLASMMKVMGPLFLKSVPEGAATEVFVATHPSVAKTRGEYFADCNVASCSALARDAELARKLWETSADLAARWS
jgi:WW domain-containing oxidoreductase